MATKEIPGPNCKYLIQIPPGHDLPANLSPAAVRLACSMAEENDWYVVQDTAWKGYTEVPLWIIEGYLTMCSEAVDQQRAEDAYPAHFFVQAGGNPVRSQSV
ncbi:MAG: hypothetical protein PVG96_11600 [Desulfobacterales bacterium]|jgi:threonine dehydratase